MWLQLNSSPETYRGRWPRWNSRRTELGDVVRRRHGVNIATFAIAGLAFQLNLPWWHAGGITVAALVGLTMAAGLSFR
jgi:hypothetical protein